MYLKIKCFDFLYKFSQKYLSFKGEFSQILSSMYVGIHLNWSLFLPDNETWIFATDSRKKKYLKYQI